MSACKTEGCVCSDHCEADMDSIFKEHDGQCCDCRDAEIFELDSLQDTCCEECKHAEPEV